MTDDELKVIEARANAATPGPWCWEQTGEKDNSWCVGVAIDENEQPLCGLIQYEDGQEIVEGIAENLQDGTFADGEFIAHARADIPALIAEARTLRKHIAAHLKVESNLIDELDESEATQAVSTMNHNQIYEAYKRMREALREVFNMFDGGILQWHLTGLPKGEWEKRLARLEKARKALEQE